MRNFLLLIRKFWNLILFVILEGISFYLIAKTRNMQGMDIISSSNAVVGYVYQKQSDIVYYFGLKRMNDSLLRENTSLRDQLAALKYIDTFVDMKARVPITVRDTTALKKDSTGVVLNPEGVTKIVRYATYRYIPARVVNNSIANDRINYITINRGAKDGIRKSMAVVTKNGIVGRVENVSEDFASVASILSNRRVSSKLSDGTSDLITFWNPGSPEYVVTEKVPIHIRVKKGDSLFTTGYSFFPENILIGTITHIDTIKATNSKNLRVKLSTNFRNLQYVYVVDDATADERRGLEATNQQQAK